MAAVTRVKARPVAPVGYEVNDKGQAKVAITAGDLLILTADAPSNGFEKVWDKTAAGGTDVMGIALMDALAGAIVSVGIQGEMDGFSGMTPGAPLYNSASVAGGLDTTAQTIATTPVVPYPTRIRAVTPTRIRFAFV